MTETLKYLLYFLIWQTSVAETQPQHGSKSTTTRTQEVAAKSEVDPKDQEEYNRLFGLEASTAEKRESSAKDDYESDLAKINEIAASRNEARSTHPEFGAMMTGSEAALEGLKANRSITEGFKRSALKLEAFMKSAEYKETRSKYEQDAKAALDRNDLATVDRLNLEFNMWVRKKSGVGETIDNFSRIPISALRDDKPRAVDNPNIAGLDGSQGPHNHGLANPGGSGITSRGYFDVAKNNQRAWRIARHDTGVRVSMSEMRDTNSASVYKKSGAGIVRIESVAENSAAVQAGLKAGDYINTHTGTIYLLKDGYLEPRGYLTEDYVGALERGEPNYWYSMKIHPIKKSADYYNPDLVSTWREEEFKLPPESPLP